MITKWSLIQRTVFKHRFIQFIVKVSYLPDCNHCWHRKAYLQISVNEEHRDFLQFLWCSDLSEEIISKYRFTIVIFGVTSSQVLLNGIVQAHGSNYEKIDPEFARKVKNHFHVDDLNTGVYSTEEGFDFNKKMKVL